MENKIISIIGLGLIGGSIALGIKRAHPDYQVIGYDTSEKSRTIAMERGIVDDLVTDLKDLAPISDIIIIAAPIKPTIDILKQLDDLDLKDQVIITDTGSTKSEIVAVGSPSSLIVPFVLWVGILWQVHTNQAPWQLM